MVSPLNKWYASRRVDSELFLVQPLQAEEDWARKSWGGGPGTPLQAEETGLGSPGVGVEVFLQAFV